ncbi:uncharacterized protein LAESUDRAFT_761167 [Laetiporus sulphureus 93-53]|uniref:Uncharacterized protein n=1 Tax=Laetiporus sulphureus 93-53 TaxID=1314785 RepID=A0A165D883_9APHY|nr:uncharacterized protein LAESUDRAFT_761167 [Laetiporus sulphureus 93-53]KZT04310.1 hypothetical protein LAESUDRAFT_761167 [Laetiporus sulphureus 93-53]
MPEPEPILLSPLRAHDMVVEPFNNGSGPEVAYPDIDFAGGRPDTGTEASESLQYTPRPHAPVPFDCLENEGNENEDRRLSETVKQSDAKPIQVAKASGWLAQIKTAVTRSACQATASAITKQPIDTDDIQLMPTLMQRRTHHPSQLPSASPLRLSLKTQVHNMGTSKSQKTTWEWNEESAVQDTIKNQAKNATTHREAKKASDKFLEATTGNEPKQRGDEGQGPLDGPRGEASEEYVVVE